MRSPAFAALLATLALLAGCASPRYQTVLLLEPPSDPAAGPCLERCAAAREDCQSRCQAARQACLKALDAEVEDAYAVALRHYAAALDVYRAELEHYRMNLWLGWGHVYGHHYLWYDPWPTYYMPMATPAPPRREAIRERLAKERCDDDCGCQARHEACFIGCGGRKVEETRCIANCPPQ